MRSIFLFSFIVIALVLLDDADCWWLQKTTPAPQPQPKTQAPIPKTDPPTEPPNPKIVTIDDGKARFTYVGCYSAPGHIPPQLKELLFTERDTSSVVWNGNLVDWYKWDIYMQALIKRCAKKAYDNDYKVFGLRYYAECYGDRSVNDAEAVFTSSMKAPSECVKEDYAVCQDGDPRCIGKHHGLAVYQMLP